MVMGFCRWRTGLTVALSGLLLVACASSPDYPPSRTGYPGSSAAIGEPDGERGANDDGNRALEASAFVPEVDTELFAATRAALADGDWVAARLALPKLMPAPAPRYARDPISTVPADPNGATFPNSSTFPASPASPAAARQESATALWIRYYEARIARQKGDLSSHDRIIDSLTRTALPNALHRELLLHRLRLAELDVDAVAEASLSYSLMQAGGHPERDFVTCEASLWRAVQRLSQAQTNTLRGRNNGELQPWLELAAASRESDSGTAVVALSSWRSRYPRHLASGLADSLLEAAYRDAQTRQLTLLLPLSGALEKAGDAVSRGFMAAYYADMQQQGSLSIDIVDSHRHPSVSAAYAEATQRGADIVIGPLGKRQVAELLAQTSLPTPLLTLNRPETNAVSQAAALLLSLAPEDEARQLAERAYADGVRRAILLRPEGVWGDRMERALGERWKELGGALPARALYGKPSTHSDAIRKALGLVESASRSAAVRGLFSTPVETSGRRRSDLDAVFLLSKSSEEARALKPMINYHYAGDLLVYALSTADSGSDDPTQNRDLGDVRLLAMPWRIAEDGITELIGDDARGSYAALHALGADAFAIARRWWRMSSTANPLYEGLTAELQVAPNDRQTLLRRLDTAEFDRGALSPR